MSRIAGFADAARRLSAGGQVQRRRAAIVQVDRPPPCLKKLLSPVSSTSGRPNQHHPAGKTCAPCCPNVAWCASRSGAEAWRTGPMPDPTWPDRHAPGRYGWHRVAAPGTGRRARHALRGGVGRQPWTWCAPRRTQALQSTGSSRWIWTGCCVACSNCAPETLRAATSRNKKARQCRASVRSEQSRRPLVADAPITSGGC